MTIRIKDTFRNLFKKIWISISEKNQIKIIDFVENSFWIKKKDVIVNALRERMGYKELRQYAYYLKDNFDEEVERIKKKPVFIKVDMDFHVGFFHAGIIIFVIEYTIIAMKRGAIPVFYINNHIATKDNLSLEWFFEQPYISVFNMSELDVKSIGYLDFSIDNIPYRIESSLLWNIGSSDWKVWKNLSKKIICKNEFFRNYIEDDKNKNGIKSEELLGVIVRGTDYIKLKPKNHPVQPDVEEIISKVQSLLETNKYSGIYIATDEERIYKQFVDIFGNNRVFHNSREYYDEIYRKDNLYQICDARKNRKNDQYFNSLEYVSSMFILSECKGIIGGNCSGGLMAALFSESEYVYFFNKGYY